MTEKIILYSIIGVAVSLAMSYLIKGTGKKIEIDNNGKYFLRMNRLYQVVGIIGIIAGLLFLIFLPLTSDVTDGGVIFVIFLMLLIFWGTGIPCLLYYNNHRLVFDKETILVTNFNGKEKVINWLDIKDMSFSNFSGLLTIKSDHGVIKIHQHLVGLSKFMKEVEVKTKWNAKQLRLPIEN